MADKIKVRVKEDALGGEDEQTIFGQTAEAGEWVEVDAKLADKVEGNPTLEMQGAKHAKSESDDSDDEAAKPRRGRPPASAA